MALTPEEVITYTARLADAEQALHNILTGVQAKVYVDQNGERVEYQAAGAGKLRAYIMTLKSALGQCVSGGPMTVWM